MGHPRVEVETRTHTREISIRVRVALVGQNIHPYPHPSGQVLIGFWVCGLNCHLYMRGALHGSSIAVGQMVSHSDEIDAAVIAEDFTAGWSDKELDRIEEQVRSHARLIVS